MFHVNVLLFLLCLRSNFLLDVVSSWKVLIKQKIVRVQIHFFKKKLSFVPDSVLKNELVNLGTPNKEKFLVS